MSRVAAARPRVGPAAFLLSRRYNPLAAPSRVGVCISRCSRSGRSSPTGWHRNNYIMTDPASPAASKTSTTAPGPPSTNAKADSEACTISWEGARSPRLRRSLTRAALSIPMLMACLLANYSAGSCPQALVRKTSSACQSLRPVFIAAVDFHANVTQTSVLSSQKPTPRKFPVREGFPRRQWFRNKLPNPGTRARIPSSGAQTTWWPGSS